jgi:hypothetical protein
MRKLLVAMALVSITLLSSLMRADACGDKTLRVGRGIRFHRMFAAAHPAAILIYAPSDSAAISPAKVPQLQSYLKNVGHRPYAVADFDKLSEALKSGHYDLVMTDLADAARLRKEIESSSWRPVVVPVFFKLTKAETAAAEKQYRIIVKNSARADDYLAAIYEVMKSKTHQPKRQV